jgi:hypothetical protein
MVDITDDEIEAARERSRIADAIEPRAKSARYDKQTGLLVVDLRNGSRFIVPAELLQGLEKASDAERAKLEVWEDGYALSWEDLDVDFTVPGLLAGRFGTAAYMAERTNIRPRKAAG